MVKTTPKQIERLYAIVTIDDKGQEDLIAFPAGSMWIALVCSDTDGLKRCLQVAEQIYPTDAFRVLECGNRKDVTDWAKGLL